MNGAQLQDSIWAAASSGGDRLTVGGTIDLAQTLALPSAVYVDPKPGTRFRYVGPPGGVMFRSAGPDPHLQGGLVGDGYVIDCNGLADYVFDLRSPQFCRFGGARVVNGRPTTRVYLIRANAVGVGYEGTRNAVFNTFDPIVVDGDCYGVYKLVGTDVANVITLNLFGLTEARRVHGIGIEIVRWSDNNYWHHLVRLELQASNAVGVVVNSATPQAEAGVYGLHWSLLAVDTFAGGGLTGRKGLVLNKSKGCTVAAYHQAPPAEGGAVIDTYADSYRVVQTGLDGGVIKAWQKGVVS